MKITIAWNFDIGNEEYDIKDWNIYTQYITLEFADGSIRYVPYTSMLWWKVVI